MSRLNAQANSAKHITFIRKIGYATKGATMKNASIPRKTARWCAWPFARAAPASPGTADMARRPSSLCAEQAGRLDHEHDRHDDEDHGVGGFGVEDLGEPLDQPEREARDDRPQDRAHAPDHHHREHHYDEVGAHERVHLVDRPR